MNLANALATDGWMDEAELEFLATTASRSKIIAELGSWKGRSTLAMAENTTGVVFAIDVWEDNPLAPTGQGMRGSIFPEFQHNTRNQYNICPVVLDTNTASSVMRRAGIRFDMIFIDACHDFEAVRQDILQWLPLLSRSGVLCGHDFFGDYPGVAQAVKLLIPKYRLVNSIWIAEEL
jgi:predicted O-methyltransferase YrrM